ncbi:hypothetical protein JCM10450v2_005467 [Rhodotorula kratochvilovae]
MDAGQPPSYTHTRALLGYLFSTYGRAKQGSSPPQPLPPNSGMSLLELSVRKLALAQSRAASAASSSKAPSEASGATDDEDAESSTGRSALEDLSDEDKTKIVIKKLEDPDIDEDEMPDEIKETLNSLLVLPENEFVNLDPLILALLHRHREDLHPTGNPLPPLPNHGSVTPGSRPSLSRSSSMRRGFPSGTLTPGGSNAAAGSRSPSHSPWHSPKPTPLALNPNSAAFKFSAGANEFRPGGSLPASGRASPAVPGTPLRSHSPMPMTAEQAQQNWAQHHSPLNTPKRNHPPGFETTSATSSPSYFPRQLDVNSAQKQKIPRMPWADISDSSGAEDDADPSYARIDDNPLPAETVAAFGGGTNSPFYSPAIPIDQAYAQHQPYPDEGDEPQWADPNAPPPDAGYFAYPGQAYPPQGYPAAQMGEYGAYAGGPMYDSALYPQQSGELTPGGSYAPQRGGGPGPAFITLPGPAPGEMPSIDFANQLSGSAGMGGIGAYALTPFDHLHSIFAGSDVSEHVLEEALIKTGFDVDSAIEYIIDTQMGALPPPSAAGAGLAPPGLAPPFSQPPQPRGFGASGSRPLVISRDSFDGFGGANGGRGSPRFGGGGSRPGTPTGEGRGVGGRVCRFYLAGNCLRSDCRFSHDVSKAVCKFWLRGHCLKGDGRCDFLHTIPPIMRADYEARTRLRAEAMQGAPEMGPDEGPELDFPTLGDAPRARRPLGGAGPRTIQLDPARTRFAGAVKFGQKTPVPVPPHAAAASSAREPNRDALSTPRRSGRIGLRPPALLPTLPTGQSLAALYIRYRQNFLELGANRNKCLAKAAECWKRGDGAGARKWSREAQDWSRQVAIEGRDSALRIVEERKRILKEAIERNEGRAGSTDDGPDRRARGHERGGGICLGVVSPAVVASDRPLTEEERTEVALDLHALHTDEAISFMGDFLLQLEAQRFQGLAFVVIGQQKHSGASAPDKSEAAGRLRLEQATTEFLGDQGWAWQNFGGILAIDCLR